MKTKKSQTQKSRPAPKKKKKGTAARSAKSTAARKPRAKKAVKPAAEILIQENPRALALAKQIAQLVLDKKANDVVILDVRGRSSYADYLVLASGESERQVAAMADGVEEKLRAEGVRPVGTEGHDTGQWVLLDYGEVVAHFFHTDMRGFYDLEGLWADASREAVS